MMEEDGQDFFGDKVRSATFPIKGTTIAGQVLQAPKKMQQRDFVTKEPKFYKDGNPMTQWVFLLQTDERVTETDEDDEDGAVYFGEDDGRRGLYAKGQMEKEIREAAQRAGFRRSSDFIGAWITVTWEKSKPSASGGSPQKLYVATVERGELPESDTKAFE